MVPWQGASMLFLLLLIPLTSELVSYVRVWTEANDVFFGDDRFLYWCNKQIWQSNALKILIVLLT